MIGVPHNYDSFYFFFSEFEVGFEQSVYVIGEGDGMVDDVVSIVKLNENDLQMHYELTIHVSPTGDHPATLG